MSCAASWAQGSDPATPYAGAVAYVEFTIEPFVEGLPGPHVTAAIEAIRERSIEVDVGPFGSSCIVDLADVGAVVGEISDAALANGATHVSVHVARDVPTAPPAYVIPIGESAAFPGEDGR